MKTVIDVNIDKSPAPTRQTTPLWPALVHKVSWNEGKKTGAQA